ncbi:flagellar hook-associated protein FlgK [candidate division GN15 bacterium]|nr:flagellar hook-associated protein FlgK [candidate division GN15 bacterium]
MPGLTAGLEIGKRALLSHQVWMQTIGHNIANVNTPGYTRQRVRISPANPEFSIHGPIGAGVQVDQLYHVRDLFLGSQYREAQKELGEWSFKDKALRQIEQTFNEPQDESLNDALNDFWNKWNELAQHPDNTGNRNFVVSSAKQLVRGFHTLAQALTDQRDAVDRDMTNMVAEVNRITNEIAELNYQIKHQELGSDQAMDLRDMRDQLTDELSSLIDVNVIEKPNGASIVSMGQMILVDGSDSFAIEAKGEVDRGVVTHRIVWAGSDVELKNLKGQLAGLIETRDKIIPSYLEELNTMARSLVEQVNGIHESGFGLNGSTGVAFFDPGFTDAINIRLNTEIEANINNIAASGTNDPDSIYGNGDIAAAIFDLRGSAVMEGGTTTINDFYSSLIGKIGVETREANSFNANYELLRTQIDNQRQSVQGVSLDEEMANLVKYQHAYDAAARVITTMDQSLDTIISRMGIVGR